MVTWKRWFTSIITQPANLQLYIMSIFAKIIRREIPADIVFEDDDVLVFRDVEPQAPLHLLVIPKEPIARIGEAKNEQTNLLGKLLLTAAKVADTLGVAHTGYRLVINHGSDAGESVPHLHVHLLAGRKLDWPPG